MYRSESNNYKTWHFWNYLTTYKQLFDVKVHLQILFCFFNVPSLSKCFEGNFLLVGESMPFCKYCVQNSFKFSDKMAKQKQGVFFDNEYSHVQINKLRHRELKLVI